MNSVSALVGARLAPDLADRWAVILCHAQAEWQVHTALLAQGVTSLLPYTLGSSRRGRWSHGVVRPVYPGYLFANIAAGNTHLIRRTAGVYDILKNAGQLVYVTPGQIRSCRKQWLDEFRQTAPRLVVKRIPKPGEWVKVPTGPFAGMPAQIETLDKSGNICASLGNLQVSFHLSDVQAVRGSAKPARNHPRKPTQGRS